MTAKSRTAPAAVVEQTSYRVRIAFEGMRVGDRFTMSPEDPYVRGLLGAGLIEVDDDASRLQAGDASAEPQATADPSRPNAGVDTRHVDETSRAAEGDASGDVGGDTSSPPADATP